MEINSRLILPRSVFISINCTDSVHVFQRAIFTTVVQKGQIFRPDLHQKYI